MTQIRLNVSSLWFLYFRQERRIATVLADNGISIFAVSTYNTDYVLIKKENYQKALEVLQTAGYKIVD